MPKIMNVKMEVPSNSREASLKVWLNIKFKDLGTTFKVISVEEGPPVEKINEG